MNNNQMNMEFQKHLGIAFRIQRDPPMKTVEQNYLDSQAVSFTVEKIYHEAEIIRAVDWFRDNRLTAFDFETNCLKPELPNAQIYSLSISNGVRTIAFPWTEGKVRKAVSEFLLSDVPKVASNLKFEDRWTNCKFGHGVANWGWDTMLAAHCLDNRPGICSLKFQALVNLGVPSYNERIVPYLESHHGPYNRIHEIPLEDLLHYNGIDSLLEVKLAQYQRRKMGL
jgi:hypothetical protein